MKGYAKINANHTFAQRSTSSKKEFVFFDHDVDLRRKSTFMQNKNETINDQLPSTIDDHDEKNKKKIQLFLEKLHELEQHEPRKNDGEINNYNNVGGGGGGILRRNFSVSSSTITNNKNKGKMMNKFQQEGSSKSIQGIMKRSFSLRKSSSVSGSSDRYCRIYDQPMRVDDNDQHGFDHDDDHDFEKNNNGENKMSNGKKKVGSKVVKACKRLFSFS